LTQALESAWRQPLSLPLDPSCKPGYKLCSFDFNLYRYMEELKFGDKDHKWIRPGSLFTAVGLCTLNSFDP
jgi:hypothetical protein